MALSRRLTTPLKMRMPASSINEHDKKENGDTMSTEAFAALASDSWDEVCRGLDMLVAMNDKKLHMVPMGRPVSHAPIGTRPR
jgi:hypothetical protein